MPDFKYTSVKLPTEMVKAIEQLIKDFPECQWNSIASFVRFAIRVNPYWIQSMYFKLVREATRNVVDAVKNK